MDLRLTIGRLLFVIGMLLIAATTLAPETIRNQLYGANLNLVWGLLLLGCGALFMLAARKAK